MCARNPQVNDMLAKTHSPTVHVQLVLFGLNRTIESSLCLRSAMPCQRVLSASLSAGDLLI